MALTYEPIATGTTGGNSITFSSIPNTYTDLRLVVAGKQSNGGTNILLNFNGDGGSNYSQTYLVGNGSSASSGRFSNFTTTICAMGTGSSTTAFLMIADIMNYSNTTTYKTMIWRSNDPNATDAAVLLYRSTSAINSINMQVQASNFTTNTIFSIYGIKAA